MKRFLLLALLSPGFLAAPAAADRLLVAGPDGFVMQADTAVGDFQYFACQCAGPIRALAADQRRLYAADEFGQLLVFDVRTGAIQGLFSLGLGQINALAAAHGSVFVGTESALVVEIDPANGALLDARKTTTAVRALLIHGGDLLAGTADSAVYRSPLEGGLFTYFSCFCFTNIQDMAVVGGKLAIVDEFGLTAMVDASSGAILSAFSAGPTNSMAVLDGDLLFYYQGSGGAITRFDPDTGLPNGSGFTSPVGVEVMLVLPDLPKLRQR